MAPVATPLAVMLSWRKSGAVERSESMIFCWER